MYVCSLAGWLRQSPPSQEQEKTEETETRDSLPDRSPPGSPLPKLQIHLHRLPDRILSSDLSVQLQWSRCPDQRTTQSEPKLVPPQTNPALSHSPQAIRECAASPQTKLPNLNCLPDCITQSDPKPSPPVPSPPLSHSPQAIRRYAVIPQVRLHRLPASILSGLSVPQQSSDHSPEAIKQSPASPPAECPTTQKVLLLRLHRLPPALVQSSLHLHKLVSSSSQQQLQPSQHLNELLSETQMCCRAELQTKDLNTTRDDVEVAMNSAVHVLSQTFDLDTEPKKGPSKQENHVDRPKEDRDVSIKKTALRNCQTTDAHYFLRPQNPLEYASMNGTGLTNGFPLKAPLQLQHKIRVDFKVGCL